jgi:hypothetical protein
MLLYCQQFCKIFPASSPSVSQRAWTAWRSLSPASRARIRRWLQTACRTPRRLSVRRPLLYVTRTHAAATGDAPAYLLETPPRTYWRRPRVPTGDAPRTYWRRPAYLLETQHNLTHCS